MGGNFENRESEPKKPQDDSHNWVVDNIAHPFVNQALIEPLNAVASVSEAVSGKKIGRVDKYDVPESHDTASWLAQTLSGGVGGIAPYVVAGKLTGGAMESSGRFLESNSLIKTGGATAQFLSSERSAMILGAGLYGGARDPISGETRFGNAVGSMVGMGAFELGNSYTKGLSLSQSIPLRALVGAGGGTAQLMTSNLISEGKVGSSDDLMRAASSGAALNLFLPAAQHQLGRAIDAVNVKMGRPIPVDHFVARENWSGNDALKSVVEKSPLTRVVRTDSTDANIDQKSNVVNLGANDGPAKLGHEVSHRISNRQAESDFREAADLLKTDPEAAKQKYIDIRIAQEKAAIEAERRINASFDTQAAPYADMNPDLIRGMRFDKNSTYGEKFDQEAAAFEKSNGKYRPTTDNSSSEYRGVDAEGLYSWVYEEAKPDPNGGDVKIGAYETNANKSFQRWTKVDAKLDENGKTWGTIELFNEPVDGPYGKFKKVESFPDKSVAYTVVDGPYEGTVVRAYTEGLDTKYGSVKASTTYDDGRIEFTKADGSTATEYKTPQEGWFGKYTAEDNKADGVTFYHLSDGGTVEFYEKPLKTTIGVVDPNDPSKIINREVEVESAWRSNGTAQRSMLDRHWGRGEETESKPVEGSAPMKSEYILADGTSLELNYNADNFGMIERSSDGQPKESNPVFVAETYPQAIETPAGSTTQVVRTFDSTISDIVDENGDTTRVQNYNPGFSRPTEFGDVTRVHYLQNGFEDMVKANGNKILVNLKKPMDSPVGPVKAVETAADSTMYYHKLDNGVVEVYPNPVSTNKGTIGGVEKLPNGLRLYGSTGTNFATMDIDFVNRTMTSFDAKGNLLPDGFQPLENFTLLRMFTKNEYPNGKSMPEISDKGIRSIETTNSGYNVYTLVDGARLTDAPQQQ
ncbi:MAG TPA: hypothetical protein V6C76_05050 [Drouetiella sp.]